MTEIKVTTKQDQWFKHMAEWEASQLSQQVFCAQYNLSPVQFGYWRKKYYKSKAAAEAPMTSSPWISLTPPPSPGAPLTITIPHRCTLTVPLHIAPAQLEILLALLGLKHVCTSR